MRAAFAEEKGKLYEVMEMTYEDFNKLKSLSKLALPNLLIDDVGV